MGIELIAPTQLAASSIIAGYDKELRMKEKLDDIYEQSSGMYLTEKKSIPDAIRMKVDEKAKAGSNNVTITWMDRLQGPGVYDPNQLVGTEVRPTTKHLKIFRNIVRKAVTEPGYGNEKLDSKPYGLYEKWVDQLAVWNKEHHGLSIRQTILEQYGESLVHGRTLATSTRNWSPNFLVAGMPIRTMQVAYNTNRATYTTNIVNRIVTSGGGVLAQLVTQTLNMPNLSNAQNLALNNRISQISIPGLPGGKGWILTMSELQGTYLGDPTWSQRNLGTVYVSKAALPEKIQNWRGVQGAFKNFLLVEDVMQPTLILSGTSEPWGMNAGYMLMGDDDDRERQDPMTRDTVFILGKACVIDWLAEPTHFVSEDEDYKLVLGRGSAKVEGLTMPIFDQEIPGVQTYEQYSSMTMVCGLPDYI